MPRRWPNWSGYIVQRLRAGSGKDYWKLSEWAVPLGAFPHPLAKSWSRKGNESRQFFYFQRLVVKSQEAIRAIAFEPRLIRPQMRNVLIPCGLLHYVDHFAFWKPAELGISVRIWDHRGTEMNTFSRSGTRNFPNAIALRGNLTSVRTFPIKLGVLKARGRVAIGNLFPWLH